MTKYYKTIFPLTISLIFYIIGSDTSDGNNIGEIGWAIVDPEVQLNDPCSCSNTQNYILDSEYFFHETIEISAGSGQQWHLRSISSGQIFDAAGNEMTLPLLATETSQGSGMYSLEFWHQNELGFCATYENDLGEILENCNTCKLPTPKLPNANYNFGTYSCNYLSAIPPFPQTLEDVLNGPYSITIDKEGCSDLFVISSLDSALPLCNGSRQTITRLLRIDRGDKAFATSFTYYVDPLATNVSCNNLETYVSLTQPTTIYPESLISSYDGFCSSNLSFSASQTQFNCSDLDGGFMNKDIPVTITVTDDCGNSNSCDAKISLMLRHLDDAYGGCMWQALQGKDFSRNGVNYYHRIKLISGVYTDKWDLVEFEGSDVYRRNGQKLSLPLAGKHIDCGFFFWEFWHTSERVIKDHYVEQNFGRKVTGY